MNFVRIAAAICVRGELLYNSGHCYIIMHQLVPLCLFLQPQINSTWRGILALFLLSLFNLSRRIAWKISSIYRNQTPFINVFI
jgi:hypothetical protein